MAAEVRTDRDRGTVRGAATRRAARRPAVSAEGLQSPKRSNSSIAVSVALHLVLGVALIRLLMIPYPLEKLFKRHAAEPMPAVERISFLALPRTDAKATAPTPGRSGGDGRPVTRTPPPPLVPPSTVPSGIPPVSPAAPTPPPEPSGTGAVVGQGGPTKGIQPSYSDPRVWVPAAPMVSAPKSSAERMDSAVTEMIAKHNDSLALANPAPTKFEKGDWTVEKNGQKWGIDSKYIRLGKVSIPTAVLALLPLNMQTNPVAHERETRLAQMRTEILEHANQAMNEAEFRNAVKRIRERKEREKKEKGEKIVAPDGKEP